MIQRSPTKTMKKESVVRELVEAEVRGVTNTAYGDETDGIGTHVDTPAKDWFMVDNRQFAKHQEDFMKEIEDAPWYYGKFSCEGAEKVLDNVPAGNFIVRSGRLKTEFYISVRMPQDLPKVRHIEVDRYKNDFVAILGTNEEAIGFGTFAKLIEYLRFNPTHFDECKDGILLTDHVDRLGITVV